MSIGNASVEMDETFFNNLFHFELVFDTDIIGLFVEVQGLYFSVAIAT